MRLWVGEWLRGKGKLSAYHISYFTVILSFFYLNLFFHFMDLFIYLYFPEIASVNLD